MAIYSVHCQIIGKGQAKSNGTHSLRTVVAAAAYRAGQALRNLADGVLYDFTRKQGIAYSEILLPEGAPERYRERSVLWNEVETREQLSTRKSEAQFCRELVIAMPVELKQGEMIKLARSFIQKQFVSLGMAADYSLHDPAVQGGCRNPHIHVMLTMRDLNQNGFGNKNRSWNDKTVFESWREQWAETCNERLERGGFTSRIDHRSNKERGLGRMPTVHLGVEATALERKGIRTEKGNINRSIRAGNIAKDCGVESPEILSNMGKLWQNAFEQRRESSPKSVPSAEAPANREDTQGRDTRRSSVQRRTYTLLRNVARQGDPPAPQKDINYAHRGDGSPGKQQDTDAGKAAPLGDAQRKHAQNSSLYNAKVIASTLSFLSSHNIESVRQLDDLIIERTAAFDKAVKTEMLLKDQVATLEVRFVQAGVEILAKQKALQSKIGNVKRLYDAACCCKVNHKVSVDYLKTSILRANYFKVHKVELEAFAASAKLLYQAGYERPPEPEVFKVPLERLRRQHAKLAEELENQQKMQKRLLPSNKPDITQEHAIADRETDNLEYLSSEQTGTILTQLKKQLSELSYDINRQEYELKQLDKIRGQAENIMNGRPARKEHER